MRIEIPQIFWHGNRDRIMSIDFYPNSNVLVTCGAETEEKAWIKLWEIEENVQDNISGEVFINENSMNNPFRSNKPNPFMEDMQVDDGNVNLVQGHTTKIRPRFVSEISGAHTATVNIVRFSPNGMYLATGGDDSAIVVWVQKSRPVEFGSTQEKVTWSNYKILRGHLSDVYDLSWSLDSKYLISGSVDNSAIVWNIEKSKGIQKFNDHSHFVQGVSWDPRNKYVVTQSSDKSVRFYKNANLKLDMKFFYLSQMKRIQQGNDNIPNNQEEKNKKNSSGANYNYYFADEIQCPTFVRRHAWSPDGSICLLVAGMQGAESDHVVWGMTRKDLSKPAFYIPTLDKSAVCIRFCPIIFKKDPQNDNEEMEGVRNSEMIDLPYKMVFAIGTLDSIFIYDTQSILPRFAITNIHYQPLTDIAWKGSSMLAASSSDGYITFISFDPEEIGKPIEVENLPEKARGSYELYLSVEMAKNIVSITNVATVIKPKKKSSRPEDNMENIFSNNNSNFVNNDNNNMNFNPNPNSNTLNNKTDYQTTTMKITQQSDLVGNNLPEVIHNNTKSNLDKLTNAGDHDNNASVNNNHGNSDNVKQGRRIQPTFISK